MVQYIDIRAYRVSEYQTIRISCGVSFAVRRAKTYGFPAIAVAGVKG